MDQIRRGRRRTGRLKASLRQTDRLPLLCSLLLVESACWTKQAEASRRSSVRLSRGLRWRLHSCGFRRKVPPASPWLSLQTQPTQRRLKHTVGAVAFSIHLFRDVEQNALQHRTRGETGEPQNERSAPPFPPSFRCVLFVLSLTSTSSGKEIDVKVYAPRKNRTEEMEMRRMWCTVQKETKGVSKLTMDEDSNACWPLAPVRGNACVLVCLCARPTDRSLDRLID